MMRRKYVSTGLSVDVIWLKKISDSANSSSKYNISMAVRKGRE
jgi:hypothetical protein